MPQIVHPSIKWSKHWPWLESETLSLNDRLELLEKLRKQKADKKAETKGKKATSILLEKRSFPLPHVLVDIGKNSKREGNAAKGEDLVGCM